ncbi:hypothetical protein NPIL_512481 [Nephila pilipes]|uniref:Uncharacterized protein n=1 Tax=Nephila pilipes TaxID=299642 RepID=A0A8X6QLH0_NEPPI|nr:hypothetical protein NPIL_512481 [Nephila pilipes]
MCKDPLQYGEGFSFCPETSYVTVFVAMGTSSFWRLQFFCQLCSIALFVLPQKERKSVGEICPIETSSFQLDRGTAAVGYGKVLAAGYETLNMSEYNNNRKRR